MGTRKVDRPVFVVGLTTSRSRRVAATVVLATVIATLVACGSSTGGKDSAAPQTETFQKVLPSDRIFAANDLLDVGFKQSRHYDVEGLPEATDALSGFWGPDPYSRKDFEVRFYKSHADAVEYGTAMAEEASGDDAKLDEDTATWKEGIKDRKRLSSGGSSDLAAWSGSVKPKYGDYSIFANMVVLCEGLDAAQAKETCASFVEALRAPGGGS